MYSLVVTIVNSVHSMPAVPTHQVPLLFGLPSFSALINLAYEFAASVITKGCAVLRMLPKKS